MNGSHVLWHRVYCGALLTAGLTWAGTSPVVAQEGVNQRPEEVTDSAIAVGRALFRGAANCSVCHGEDGRGSEVGPDLTDRTWLHGDGSYGMISKLVLHGLTRYESTDGQPMPMRGWAPIDDDEIRAVAAYVWSIGPRLGGSARAVVPGD